MSARGRKRWAAAFAAAALTLCGGAPGAPRARAQDGALRYQTSCAVAEANWVDGYVSNLSEDGYRVLGQARFRFYEANSISRPEIVIEVDGEVPAGQTARVARASVARLLRAGETCVFDVTGSIQKS